MERLHFSVRARRRARRQRLKRIALGIWVVALVAGVPGATAAFDLLDRFAGDPTRDIASVAGGLETSESAEAMMKFQRKAFETRPDPTPTPAVEPEVETAPIAPEGSVEQTIYAAAAEFGLAGDYLLSVASCESGLDPGATNPAGYHGLFQFDDTTWAAYGYGSIYDPTAQARTAARLLAAGQASRWPNCA